MSQRMTKLTKWHVRPAKTNQPGRLIGIFAERSMGSRVPKLSSCGQRRLWSDWANAQADLRWAHMLFCWFCHALVIMLFVGLFSYVEDHVSHDASRHAVGYAHPAKIQINMLIRAVGSESSQGAFWIDKNAKFLHAVNEDSNQTARMRRLIWVFVGGTCRKVRFLTSRLMWHFNEVIHKDVLVYEPTGREGIFESYSNIVMHW